MILWIYRKFEIYLSIFIFVLLFLKLNLVTPNIKFPQSTQASFLTFRLTIPVDYKIDNCILNTLRNLINSKTRAL